MDSAPVQLKGNIKFGLGPSALVDYSCEVAALVVTTSINTVTKPPTFVNGRPEQRKSSLSDSVTVAFFADEAEALWLLVWTAMRDDTTATDGRLPGELYFSATYKEGAANPTTNPEFRGWLLPTALATGAPAGQRRLQSQTWQARELVKVS